MRSVHQDESTREQEEFVLDLDEIARQGARKMLAQALEAEVEAYLRAGEGERDEHKLGRWWSEMATPEAARSSVGPGLSRLGLRG
jgi:hypothetical protein